jgi:CheY-like chemotaxis protein
MSIVKNLLDMMDSELEVKSEYGKGSEFGFVLRQEVISWEPMGDFAKMYQKSIESAKEYSSYFEAPDAQILVVDDTKMNLTVIKGLLEPTKVNVTTATSGLQAVEKVKQEHFDLIFLDQRMPGLDGIETLQEMKKTMPERIENTPIIALTANAISGARERFIKAGFDDYLTKPIDSMKLERTIAAFLPEEKVVRMEADGLGVDASGGSDVTRTASGGSGVDGLAQLLQHHLAGAVAQLASGDLAVLDGHDGVLRVAAGEIVDQHLAVVAKLHGQRLGQPLVEIKVHTIRPFRAWLRDALLSTYDI